MKPIRFFHAGSFKLFSILVSCILFSQPLQAAEPIVTIGKPPLSDICYSPDGRFLATLVNAYVKPYIEFLDAETFVPVGRIDGTDGEQLTYSPDGRLFAVFGRKGIQLWEVDARRLLETIPVDIRITSFSPTQWVTFSPDGKYLAYAVGDSVSVWDIAQRQTTLELTNEEEITTIAFQPNRPVLAVGSIGINLIFWDVTTGERLSQIDTIAPHPKLVRFSPDGTFLAVGTNDNAVRLFEMIPKDKRDPFVLQATELEDLGFTLDGQYLLVGEGNGCLRAVQIPSLWQEKRQAVDRLPSPNSSNHNRLERLTFHPDGQHFASLINSERIVIWDAQSLSRLQTLYGWTQTYAQAIYFPELNRIVTGIYTNVLHFWNAKTGELIKTVEFYRSIYQLQASPDGREFAIDVEETNQIWDAESMEPLYVFPINGFTIAIAFSSSGRYLASNAYRGTFVWDTETGEEINRIETGSSDFQLLMFTPDETQIALIPPDRRAQLHPAGNSIVFWEIQTGTPVREIEHIGPLVNVGGHFLQARDTQEAIEIVDVETNRLISRIPKRDPFYLKQRFPNVQFHPSGNIVVIDYPNYSQFTWEYQFYNARTGELLTTLTLPEQGFRFVGDGDYIFLMDEKRESLGLYRTSEVLGVPETVAVEPQGKQFVRWGAIKRNALLQNYPNPFNPETWMPFRLEKESAVTFRIYDGSGALVRDLPLGVRPAGDYLSRGQAAYWDGRNNAGEPVASGVYFYTIHADKFSETRKMLNRK